MPWGNWGNPDDVNKALQMTGSNYQVPAAVSGVGGNPLNGSTDAAFQNDLRRQIAENNGMKARAEAADSGKAPAGGGGGIMSALTGMAGGGGMGGGGGGAPPPQQRAMGAGAASGAAQQAAMVANEQERKAAESQARTDSMIGIFGKIFGLG